MPIQNSSCGRLLVFCHKRHDFPLKMHNKAFGGRGPPEISSPAHNASADLPAGFRGWPPEEEGRRGKERRERERGRDTPFLHFNEIAAAVYVCVIIEQLHTITHFLKVK